MDNMEKLYGLTIGSIRKLLADLDASLILDDVIDNLDLDRYLDEDAQDDDYWDDEDEDTDYDEDDELWDDEDDDAYYDEDEEENDPDLDEDEVCVGGALPIPEEEEMAQSIAADIRAGHYTLGVIAGVYNDTIIGRVNELV